MGHCGRVPRRYRDRDVFWWLRQLATRGAAVGAGLPTAASLPDPRARFVCNPHLSGHGGGREVNLRRMAADGVRLVGRFETADGGRARFRADLTDNLAFADRFFEERIRGLCDRFADLAGEDLPADEPSQYAFEPPEVTELDLAAENIGTVLWTSGYRPSFDWLELPIFDELGVPRQVRGLSDVPGLSFIGLPWQHDMGSANLVGLTRDAEHLAAGWTPAD